MPAVPRLSQKVIGSDRSPCSSGIELTIAQRLIAPSGANAIDNLPGDFNLVATDKQGRVPGHSFQQQPFVGFGCIRPELRVITEMHPHWPDFKTSAGNL